MDAYRELVRRFEPMVFGTCLRMIQNQEDAEEVCQDAFLQVFHKIGQFEGRSSFKTWLFRIVFNLSVRRRENIAKRAHREIKVAGEIAKHSDHFVPPEGAAGQISLGAEVEEALSRLDGNEQRVLILKFVSGLSLQEIADVFEVGLSAAKMRTYRALESFRDAYQEATARKGGPR
ncbi:MAG: sigma-70 family RNA polymerase sigma factor [Verrucomicrobiales bacterium]